MGAPSPGPHDDLREPPCHILNLATHEWLRDHLGVITAERLAICGISASARQRLVAARILIPMHRGVYRIASQPLSLEVRCAALSAFQPTGFVTGPTGGKLNGLRRMPTALTPASGRSTVRPLEVIHFAVPHGGWLRQAGVQMRQSRAMDPTEVQVRRDGIRVAAPWRLAFDLAADLSVADLESVVEQILSKQFCQFVTLAATARRLARPARPGSAAFVSALANRVPGGPLESHPEVRLAKSLQAAGVPIVAQATWLDLPNGRRARLDISVPGIRWGLEIDVHPDHFLQSGTADRRRDRQCHQVGWQVDRVTAIDMLDLEALTIELVDVYAARCAEQFRLIA